VSNLPGFLQGLPVWLVFTVLALGAYARGNATYWVGRGARSGSEHTKWKRYAETPAIKAAERWVRRMGPPLVSIGFLTVGVQSAINFSAGLLRMPQRTFQPAVIIGALLWSTLYTTVGFAVIEAAFGHLSWWWALIALAVLAWTIGYSRWLSARGERQGREILGDEDHSSNT
jgi:membrane protein DedA with SNARE-associated domain